MRENQRDGVAGLTVSLMALVDRMEEDWAREQAVRPQSLAESQELLQRAEQILATWTRCV